MVFEWTKKDALNLRAEVRFLPALYIHHVAHAICFRACYLNGVLALLLACPPVRPVPSLVLLWRALDRPLSGSTSTLALVPSGRSFSRRLHFEANFLKNPRFDQPRNGLHSREYLINPLFPPFARAISHCIRQKGDLERDHGVHGMSSSSGGGSSASESSGGDIFQKLSAILENQNLDLGNINMFNRGGGISGATTAGAAGEHAGVSPYSPQEHPQPPRRQSSLSANSSVFYPSSHYSTSSSISVSSPQTPTTPSLSNILGLSTTDTGTGQPVKTFQVRISKLL